jgi:hypothetical protein
MGSADGPGANSHTLSELLEIGIFTSQTTNPALPGLVSCSQSGRGAIRGWQGGVPKESLGPGLCPCSYLSGREDRMPVVDLTGHPAGWEILKRIVALKVEDPKLQLKEKPELVIFRELSINKFDS